MSRLSRSAGYVVAATVFFGMVVSSNLTGLGLGRWPLTYDDVALPRLVIAMVGTLVAWLLVALSLSQRPAEEAMPRPGLSWHPLWGVSIALAAWAGISALASRQGTIVWLGQSERLEGFVTIVLYALLLGLGLQAGSSRRVRRAVSIAVAAGGTVLAVYGILQVLGLDRTDYTTIAVDFAGRLAFASVGNPNFLGGVLVLALPVALALAWAYGGARRWIPAVCALAMAVALYLTSAQSAWLATVVQVACAFALFGRVSTKTRVAVAMSVVLVGIAGIVGLTALGGGLRSDIVNSSAKRVELVAMAVSATEERPLVGHGPDTFLAAFRRHRSERFVELAGVAETSNNAHSWPFQYLATMGAPGVILLAVLLFGGLWVARPRGPADASSLSETLLTRGLWLGLLGAVVDLQFNVATLPMTVPLWVVLGMLLSPRSARLSAGRLAARFAAAALVLTLVVALAASGVLLAADNRYLASRLAYKGLAEGDAVELSAEAAQLNPLSVKYARGLAQARSQLVFDAIASHAHASRVRTLYRAAEGSFRQVLRIAPDDYAALSWLTALQYEAGQALGDGAVRNEAIVTAKRAGALDPLHWELVPLLTGKPAEGAVSAARSAQGLP